MDILPANTRREVLRHAPCKLNLFLEILGKRADGYHDIESLMVTVSLSDTLWMTATSAGQLDVDCRWAAGLQAAQVCTSWGASTWEELPPATDNLAYRALCELRRVLRDHDGVRLVIEKRVPLAAGLGGASSDAAGALQAAAEIWSVTVAEEEFARIAERLGSDVPFFLRPGAAVVRGRGERLQPLPRVPRYDFVVVRPPVGLRTRDVYQRCRPPERPRRVEEIVDAFLSGDPVQLGRALYNRLQETAERMTPWIGKLCQWLNSCGCTGSQMSGSGSSVFGVCRHARHARWVARRLHALGVAAVFHVSTHTNPSLRSGGLAEGDRHGNHRGSHQARGEHG